MTIAIFHFHVEQIKRSEGRTSVAAAAYRAGERLYNEWDGETSDYTRKGGVVLTEILLPSHVPKEYSDRAALWNSVEQVEKGKKAQLAYSFDLTLPNELTREENIQLAHQFCQEQFVSHGMIVDLCIHDPERKGIPNPHFHVLCPIRPMLENGTWGSKQKRVYRLDEKGQRIRKENGDYLFDAVPTTDWGRPETLEEWRRAWAELVNQKLEEKGETCRIDHRSFVRQGIDQIPTIHEGVAVRQMEARGIKTDKHQYNLEVQALNKTIRWLKKAVKDVLGWLTEINDKLKTPKQILIADLLLQYMNLRQDQRMDWSGVQKLKGLSRDHNAVLAMKSYLESRNISTLHDLVLYVKRLDFTIQTEQETLSPIRKTMKELDYAMQNLDALEQFEAVFQKYNSIFFKGAKQNYFEKHKQEITQYQRAKRYFASHPEYKQESVSALKLKKVSLAAQIRQAEEKVSLLKAEIEQFKKLRYWLDQVDDDLLTQAEQEVIAEEITPISLERESVRQKMEQNRPTATSAERKRRQDPTMEHS